MPKADWAIRLQNWMAWYASGGGPFFNHGQTQYPYYLKNYNFASQTAYASDPSKMVTLTEGQSYGMLYAVLADDLKSFVNVFKVMLTRHKMTSANITSSKTMIAGGKWNLELADWTTNTGVSIYENGSNVAAETFGWVWSQDYSSATGDQTGLASVYMAPDGDVVYCAALLMAYERWNIPGFLTEAVKTLGDLAKYGTRKCGTRYALTMGGYRGGGGFVLPANIAWVIDGNIYPTSDVCIFNTADLTTGDAVRFLNTTGATMPAPLLAQDVAGVSWPKYYIRVNESYNVTLFNTKADAVANTNRIDITTSGTGTLQVCPYETQAGSVGTDPSYLFADYFRLFALYDTANAAIWSSLATNAYGDIQDSCTHNYWNMPTYLEGVNILDGTRVKYASGGDSAAHSADAIRCTVNLAMDGSPNAIATLKTQCQFNSTTNLWEPKPGPAGGIWRYWLDTGFIPFTMGSAPVNYTFAASATTVSTSADTINLGVQYLADNGNYSTPVHLYTGTLPAPLTNNNMYWLRCTDFFTTYSFHPTQADALANTNKIDLTNVGSGNVQFSGGFTFTPNVSTDNISVGIELTMKTGDAVRVVPQTTGTMPGGLVATTTYFIRLTALKTATLHTTSAGAIANTNKVDITSAGTGAFFLTCQTAPVQWVYRGGVGGLDPISPYGCAQIMAYKYALNGLADAEAFYNNSVPAWVQQQPSGAFAENNGDYYIQHMLGLITAVFAGATTSHYNGRGYLSFTAYSDAMTFVNQLTTGMGKPYGVILTNGTVFVVAVTGINVYNLLTAAQKSALIKTLPAGNWMTASAS